MAKKTPQNKTFEDLNDLKAILVKKYGEGAVRFPGDAAIVNVEAVPTGIISIDRATGIGGIPRGRIIEIFGPESSGKTTTCLQIAAAFQKHIFSTALGPRNGRVAFIDAEHALDPNWAKKIGCNFEEMIFCQPDHGQQAYDVIEMIVKSGKVELVVLDSIAALAPKEELEGELEDNQIGAQARMNSKALRRLKGTMSDNGCTLMCVNQIREKIGVMFGCLHADTLIPFVDGRIFTIRQVCDEKIQGEVWSYNEKLRSFEPRKIVDWHYNGDVENSEDYLHVSLRGPGTKNGTMQITVTPNHEVLHNNEFVPIDSLNIGDVLTTKQDCFVFDQNQKPNGTLGQFLIGILSGDSHISHNQNKLGASLKLRDNVDTDYMDWKSDMLSTSGLRMTDYKCNSGRFYVSPEISEFAEIKRDYPNRDPMLLLNNFSWLGFAVWIMDDAIYERKRYQLSIKRFAGDGVKLDEISYCLDELGLFHHMSRGGNIIFDVDVSELIASKISPFVPKCMDRKLPIHHRGYYEEISLYRTIEFRSTDAIITNIRPASKKQMKQRGKYDLSIEHNHNYMAGGNPVGVIVHNSPETTPGGRALKFYASIRMEIRRGGKYEINKTLVGFETRAKFLKNKVAEPFSEANYNICFGNPEYPVCGIDPYSNLLDAATEAKVIVLKGSHFSFDGDVLGNGAANAATALRLSPNIFKKIYDLTITQALQNVVPITLHDTDDAEDTEECLTQPQSTNQETQST